MLLEVCIDSVASAIAAEEGGAKRVELCAGLTDGGITPTLGMIEAVKEAVNLEIMVILRPRGGDFLYSEAECKVIEKDLRNIQHLGIHGVVFGALLPDGSIDKNTTLRVREWAGELDFTFHRAFDMSADPMRALEDLMEIGIPRLLTSGQAATAPLGKELIKSLVERAGPDLVVMPGGGIYTDNVKTLVEFTRVKEIHATCRKAVESGMKFTRSGVYMGIEGSDEYSWKVSDPQIVKEMLFQANGGKE